jgi:hypothetical protein
MAKNKYSECFLKPRITQAGEFQVFTLKGKDTRGFNFTVRLSPVSKETIPGDLLETADSDRIEAFIGGDPKEIENISGAVEVKLGKEAEAHVIKEASMVYIPKGMPVKHRVTKEPKDPSFMVSFSLTPKWEEPAKKKKGGK